MRHHPNLINAYDISAGQFHCTTTWLKGTGYCIARPITAPTLRQRVVWAWRVFTGRYDALVWPGQED